MAFYHAITRELHVNIAYFGPALGGKLTNLRYIYERITPEVRSEWDSAAEPFPVVAYYFTPAQLPPVDGATLCFHLSAIPGQVFAETGRKAILRNVDAVVFVADAQLARFEASVEMWENLAHHLAEQGRGEVPTVLQINKLDLPDLVAPEELAGALGWSSSAAIPAVACQGSGVFDTLKACAKLVLLGLRSGQVKREDFVLLKAPREPLRLWNLFRSDVVGARRGS